MANSYRKDFVGEEDIAFDTNRSNETFERQTSKGEFHPITKVNATHIPITDQLDWEDAETVQEALVLAKATDDFVREIADDIERLQVYLGSFDTPEQLISEHPDPVDDAFAFVNSTGTFFHWDQLKLIPAWQEIYKGFPVGRDTFFPSPIQTIDWSQNDVFDLGLIVQNIEIQFINVIQSKEIVINFTLGEFLTVNLPVSLLHLDGKELEQDEYNSIHIIATNGSAQQEGTFYTATPEDTEPPPEPEPEANGILPIDVLRISEDHLVSTEDVNNRIILDDTTIADRIVTINPVLITHNQAISFANESNFRLEITLTNPAGQTINNISTSRFLYKGDPVLTLNGDSASNLFTISGG